MQILVTGATGFLGTHLCKTLISQGHAVTQLNSKNCDLTQQGSLEAFSSIRFDQIFHLAAWTQAGDFCLHHPGEQFVINERINVNVLSWWQQHQAQAKFVFMGTSCSYAPESALIEENYLVGQPIESLFTYGMTKRMLYIGAKALAKQYDLRYLCLVPSTLYGAGYHTDGRQMHFIFDLIRKILRGKHYNEPVILWGDGHQKRELVLVDDFVQALLTLNLHATNDLINIGAGEEYSIRQFAEEICQQIGYDAHLIQYDETKYVGAKSKVLNIGKMKSLIPNLNLTPLAEGLRTTIHWFEEARAY